MASKLFTTALALSMSSMVMAEISPAFRTGNIGGPVRGLQWELRVNLPDCDHQAEGEAITTKSGTTAYTQKKDAWCTYADRNAAVKKSGVEDKIIQLANDENTKSIYLTFFSFSAGRIKDELCKSILDPNKKLSVHFVLDSGSENSITDELEECMIEGNEKYGTPYSFTLRGAGLGHLYHAKIIMASPATQLVPLHEMTPSQVEKAKNRRVNFSSSSANLSSSGVSLHIENWLFMNDYEKSFVTQKNICYLRNAIQDPEVPAKEQRQVFAQKYAKCVKDALAFSEANNFPRRSSVEFYGLPADSRVNGESGRIPHMSPYRDMKKAVVGKSKNGVQVTGAVEEVLVGIHRLTTSAISKHVLKAVADRGVNVRMVMDDDTLVRSCKDPRTGRFEMSAFDVNAYYQVRRAGAEISFYQTKAATDGPDSLKHIMHSKFIVADPDTERRVLFQGAGNFTAGALNTNARKSHNYEQFYLIKDEGIVKAYRDFWNELRGRSTLKKDHPDFACEEWSQQDIWDQIRDIINGMN